MKPLCIIPARGGSKRFPRKNIAPLSGKPLIVYSIETAITSDLFNKVIVSTEDEEIAEIAANAGATIHVRDPLLASDTKRLPEVCTAVLHEFHSKKENYEIFCLLQPTCPLRTVGDLTKSLTLLSETDANYVMSVCEYEEPPFWALSQDENGYLKFYWGEQFITYRDSLPKLYRHNGSIIWAKTEMFQKEKEFMAGSKINPYLMPFERSVDVDYPIHLKIAELLLKDHDF